MHQYIVAARFTVVRDGLIVLTGDQASARLHLLKYTDAPCIYEVTGPITFKQGECFGMVEPVEHAECFGLSEILDGSESEPQSQGASANPETYSVRFLAARLGLNIKDTIELLKEYEVTAQNGNTVLEPDVFETVASDKQTEE